MRSWFPRLALAMLLGAVAWVISGATLTPAEFTFVNETEPESLDPARATGRPEHRLIIAMFEGLVNYDQRTLKPLPGVAERWDISEDRLQYTFHLRHTACWSDGKPLTAHDFVWSLRRLLDPNTGARYAYQLWYARNARKYTTFGVEPGESVEVELIERPPAALLFARGIVLKGKLIGVEQPAGDAKKPPPKIYTVEIAGARRRFCMGADATSATQGEAEHSSGAATEYPAKIENCKLLTLDFDEVGIRALDDYTLRITLEQPTPFFLDLAGYFALSPTPAHVVERYGFPDWLKPQNFVSNGPYVLESRRFRDRLRMAKNPRYWNRYQVAIETIDALSVTSSPTALNMYLTGAADWITTVPPIVVGDIKAQQRPDFISGPELTVNFYLFNLTEPPLDNRLVRKALGMAIDRQEIVDRVTRAGELPAFSFVPPGIQGYRPAEGLKHDLDAARKLLAEAGFPNGDGLPNIKILYNQDDTHESIAQLIQDQWKRHLGVNATLGSLEWGTFLSNIHLKQYQVCRYGWVGDYPDPNTFLDLFVSGGANNSTGFSSPEYDRLIAAAGAEVDPRRRFEILREAETLLLDEMPLVPLYFRVSRNMVSPRVHGFHSNLLDVHPLQDLSIDKLAH